MEDSPSTLLFQENRSKTGQKADVKTYPVKTSECMNKDRKEGGMKE